MASKRSAGILLHRVRQGVVQVLLGHMGGPFWVGKDEGGWSIPKGEYGGDEDPFEVALREFQEELGSPVPANEFSELGSFRQPSGKVISVWAAEGDLDASRCVSNTFEMEWPKGSGIIIEVPEIDRAEWFDVAVARKKLLKGQVPALEALMEVLRMRQPILAEGEEKSGSTSVEAQASLF